MSFVERESVVRVILAAEPRVLCDLLDLLFRDIPGVQVVGRAEHPIDLLVEVGRSEADVVVQTWSSDRLPPIATHLLAEYPRLHIVGISATGSTVFSCRDESFRASVSDRLWPDLCELIRTGSAAASPAA